jgi:hypothetical protein
MMICFVNTRLGNRYRILAKRNEMDACRTPVIPGQETVTVRSFIRSSILCSCLYYNRKTRPAKKSTWHDSEASSCLRHHTKNDDFVVCRRSALFSGMVSLSRRSLRGQGRVLWVHLILTLGCAADQSHIQGPHVSFLFITPKWRSLPFVLFSNTPPHLGVNEAHQILQFHRAHS